MLSCIVRVMSKAQALKRVSLNESHLLKLYSWLVVFTGDIVIYKPVSSK